MITVETDCLIFGGGITGLWLLNRLRQKGYSTLLLNDGPLGGHQTLNSAGMIHGGLKYGLAALRHDEQLDDMPPLWQQCLDGSGEIDLSQVKVLAQEQHLWAEPGHSAQAALYLAAHLIKGQVNKLAAADYPSLFKNLAFHGDIYRLAYPVIDPVSLTHVLSQNHADCIYDVPRSMTHIETSDKQATTAVFIHQGTTQIRIRPRYVMYAAGEGNDLLARKLGIHEPLMTAKPVHMTCIQHERLPVFYGHCLGAHRKQRLTITTHQAQGKTMWYVGGEQAEQGVERDDRRQAEIILEELKALLPWQSLQGARCKSLLINRVYSHERGLLSATTAHLHWSVNNAFIWPTRLILAPNAAHQVLSRLQQDAKLPHHAQPEPLPLPQPAPGLPAWEKLFSK